VINFPDPTLRRSLTPDDPSAFAAPAQFGPFRVLHQIGVGALGPVFRTYEPERDRLVAVKAFRLDITPEQAQALADELSRCAEAGLFHPSIVEPIAAGVQGTAAYRGEEYVAAESLDVAMRHYAPAPIATVLPFITQLAGAIDFARAAGVGHGALHPRDIFVTPEEARATGFGVVEALERVGLRAPVRRPYSAPERIAGQPWTTTADVFSLAAITFELLTGRRPAGLGGEIGTLTAGTPNTWMDGLHAVLARAMDADPAARYPTALTFASALEAAGRGDAAAEPQRTIPPAPAASPAPPLVSSAAPSIAVADAQSSRPADSRTGGPSQPRTSVPADPLPGGPADPRTREPAQFDDITSEREEDEAEHHLRIEETTAVPADAFSDLDGDIAAEAEADRFAADDFLLDAAGAASAPAPPSLNRLSTPLPVDPLAFEDNEVMIDEAPPRAPFGVPAPSLGYSALQEDDAPASSRFPWTLALMVVLALAAGAVGGWFFRGRTAASDADHTPPSATTGSGAASPAPAGREFSEQAVAPAPGSGAAASPPPAETRSPETASPRPPAGKPAVVTTGTLVVKSTPSGAGVTLNGRWRGRTPLTIDELPLRSYDVRVVQSGFQAATQSVALTSETPQRSLSLRLQRSRAAARPPTAAAEPPEPETTAVYTGSIYVDSRPRGARVSIDGRAVGITPLRVPDVRIGTHVVRLELPDHRIWSAAATVSAGEERRVTGSLERIQ
jgi:serine/threonine protein kinase